MYCKYCGEEIHEGAKFCQNCGHELEDIHDVTLDFTKKEEGPVADTGPYKVFAIVGYVSGFISLALCWVPFMFVYSIIGLVLACLGTSSLNPERKNQARIGRNLSIIGISISIIVTLILIIFIVVEAIKR